MSDSLLDPPDVPTYDGIIAVDIDAAGSHLNSWVIAVGVCIIDLRTGKITVIPVIRIAPDEEHDHVFDMLCDHSPIPASIRKFFYQKQAEFWSQHLDVLNDITDPKQQHTSKFA